MNAENARQCLTDIGCSPDRIDRLAELVEAGRLTEAKQRLRCLPSSCHCRYGYFLPLMVL